MASYKSKRGARNISRARKKKRGAKKASFDADVAALEAETAVARRAEAQSSADARSAKLSEPGAAQDAMNKMRSQDPAAIRQRKSELAALGYPNTDYYAFGGPVGGKSAKGRDGIASSGLTKGPNREY